MGFVGSEEEAEQEDESEQGSLSPDVRRQTTPTTGRRMKTTIRSPKGKSPVRDLSCLDDDDDVFQRVQDDLYQVQSRYNKMEVVIRSATKLLGDCKTGNLSKEIRKLKEEGGSKLKTYNEQLKLRMAELQGIVQSQGAEVERLRARNADLGKIREALALPADVILRAQLFDEDIKKEGQISGQKILTLLVKYSHKMEATLAEMRKLLPEPVASAPIPPPNPEPVSPPRQSEKPAPTYEELKEKVEAFTQATSEIMLKHFSPAKPGVAPPVAASPSKGKGAESGTAAASSEPTSEKGSDRKKKKLVTPEPRKAVVLSTSDSSEEEEKEEEEDDEDETPLVDKRRLRSAEKKKPPIYKSSQASKRQQKSAEKEGSTRKKPKK